MTGAIGGWNSFDLRMYDANVGRWLSKDPMGQYWSPYEGMGNNPVSNSDPTGGSAAPPDEVHFDTQTGSSTYVRDDRGVSQIDIFVDKVYQGSISGGHGYTNYDINSDKHTPMINGVYYKDYIYNSGTWYNLGAVSDIFGTADAGVTIAELSAASRIAGTSSSKIFRIAGPAGSIAGTVLDLAQLDNYNRYGPNVDNVLSPEHFAANLFMTGVGEFGGSWGKGYSVGYFIIDTYYPGGAYKATSDLGTRYGNMRSMEHNSFGRPYIWTPVTKW